jgi:pantoate--beta-alanine ligase
MHVFDRPDAVREWSRTQRAAGVRVAVVPTMGALHGGHLALIGTARLRAEAVVVTIFVNPLQFNQPADFEHYPHDLEADLAICERAGTSAIYVPTAATMYPGGFDTQVVPGAVATPFEGAMRPGHFTGVATVVTKLFTATEPDIAVFGQKDFQQLAVVRRLAADLDLAVEVVGVPTVRDHDGLALSSRNSRLTPDDRSAAVAVPDALEIAAAAFDAGQRDSAALVELATNAIAGQPRARLEYVAVVDGNTLEAVGTAGPGDVLLIAAWFGDVRLIDNRQLGA